MIDGAVSPHEGLTQTQETQVFEDTQVMEETEEGEIDVNLEGRDTRVCGGRLAVPQVERKTHGEETHASGVTMR